MYVSECHDRTRSRLGSESFTHIKPSEFLSMQSASFFCFDEQTLGAFGEVPVEKDDVCGLP